MAHALLQPLQHLSAHVSKKVRADGRGFLQSPPLSLRTNILPLNSIGSSIVQSGGTVVSTTVTVAILPQVSAGDVAFSLVHNPVAAGGNGPMMRDIREATKYYESRVGTLVRESGFVDVARLNVLEVEGEGESDVVAVHGAAASPATSRKKDFYRLIIVSTVLSDNGSLLPAILTSVTAALKTAVLPGDASIAVSTSVNRGPRNTKVEKREVNIVREVVDTKATTGRRLALVDDLMPVCTQFAYLPPDGPVTNPLDYYVIDPDKAEEVAALTPSEISPESLHYGGGLVSLTLNLAGNVVDLTKFGGGSGRENTGFDVMVKLEEIARERVSVLSKHI
jgi:exosome complex RNA-binding protein Rrp42 (RNase PH superfamily)